MPVRNEADPRWDSLKSTIESLYLKNPLEGEKGVMETMAGVHRFSKTKSQYESQFKIWGIRKYRKKDDWKSISRNIAERKRAGKESNVYINGDMILRSKVQKETRRHGFVTALEQNRSAPIPPIPDGFEIRTPIRTTATEDIVPLLTLPRETPSFPIGTETPILASSQWQIVSSALPSQTVISDASLDVLQMSPPRVTTDLSPIQSQNAILDIPYAAEIYGSPISLFDDDDKYFRRLNSFFILPFCQLKEDLLAQVESSQNSTNAQMLGSEMTLETILLPEQHHLSSSRDFTFLHEILKGSETPAAVFKALLPSENDQMILRSNYSHSDSASSKIFSLLIFAMANNFAGLNSVPIEEITDFLNRHASTQLLQQILSTSGPESEAFAEKLFQAAILMEEAHIVKALLQKGLVPNDLVCVHQGAKFTPLEYSSMVWNVEITRLLLDAKSDVNRSIEGEEGRGGAIARALTRGKRDDEHPHAPIPSEIVHMLLEAGGKISWREVSITRLEDSQKVFDLLLDHALKTMTYDQAWYEFARYMRNFDNATVTKTVARFLKAGAVIDGWEYGRSLIDSAAERGNFELVRLLLRSRASSTRETLTSAIKSRNKELIKFLLDDGAVVSAFEESATKHRYDSEQNYPLAPSPLSEAMRWGDHEILELLEEKGAWSRIVNKAAIPGEFEDVLIAAVVRGQITMIQRLLYSRPPKTYGRDLSDALVAAIHLNKDAIVLMLLDAGANVNEGLYIASEIDAAVEESFDNPSNIDAGTHEIFHERSRGRFPRGPALVEALLQRNERLVRLILDADVYFGDRRSFGSGKEAPLMTPLEAAVEWGNLSIIEEVIRTVGTSGWQALELSVRRKDLQCTQLLVNAGVFVSPTALSIAVTNNDIEMVEYLFSVGAIPTIPDALYEIEALPSGLPMIERLITEISIRYPHDFFRSNVDPYRKAIRKGNFALVELLLKAKIAVDFDFEVTDLDDRLPSLGYNLPSSRITQLGEAIMQRHTKSFEIFQRLMSELGNPNVVVRTSQGIAYDIRETAILVAIGRKDRQKVQFLIDAGADVNWPAMRGVKRTPLQKSAEIGSYEITQLLIDKGGLVNNEPAVRGGATALQLAAIGGYIGIAQLLLANDADVNAPAAKFYGRTALEGAAEHGRVDMLNLLWNAGAKFHGTEYEKARELAKENGHMATWRYLETLYPSSEMASMDY